MEIGKNGTKKLDWIQRQIAGGATVYIITATRATKITPATWRRWEASGRPLLKVGSDGALLMAVGRRYVDASYCQISSTGRGVE